MDFWFWYLTLGKRLPSLSRAGMEHNNLPLLPEIICTENVIVDPQNLSQGPEKLRSSEPQNEVTMNLQEQENAGVGLEYKSEHE